MTTPDIVPIFASPFARVPLAGAAQRNAALAALLTASATKERRDPALPADRLCFRSREDLFEWRVEAVGALRHEMLAGVCNVVRATCEYTEADFPAPALRARARFLIVRPDGCVPASTAPMASWYALYCVAAPPADPRAAGSGALRLYGLRNSHMYIDAGNVRLRAPFEPAHMAWQLLPGVMAVFPAALLHEVTLNRGTADLIFVGARVRFTGAEAVPW